MGEIQNKIFHLSFNASLKRGSALFSSAALGSREEPKTFGSG